MKNLAGILIFIMLLVLSFTVVSCSKNEHSNGAVPAGDEITPKSFDGTGTGISTKDELKSPIPDDVKFVGQKVAFYVYYPETGGDGIRDPARATIISEEYASGDVVYEAIYKRNMEVMEKLGVSFEFKYIPGAADDTYANNMVSKAVKAGAADFDMVIGRQHHCVQLATQGIFQNLAALPYLNINNPWWATQYINDMTIGSDKLMFVTGDIATGWLARLSTMYFNKNLYSENFGNTDEMYKLVLDGKWTLDKFGEMVKGMYADLNGDGKAGDEDRYGLITHTVSQTDHFTYASGIRATARDADGLPYLIFNNEKTVTFVDKLYNLYYNNPGTFVVPTSHSNFNNIFNEKFAAGETLFIANTLGTSEQLRYVETDFGMIPFPKFDEKEPSYLALVHDTAPLMCVPVTNFNDELVGAALEEMAYKGYMYMTPAFFETALKNKYMRDSDDMAMKCVDIIRENAVTDFLYVYNYNLSGGAFVNGMGLIMRDLMGAKSSDFVSKYEKLEQKTVEGIDKIIDAYMN